jgi:hypothetical protein
MEVGTLERGLDDTYLASKGLESSGQYMFIQRWTELLNPRTIGTYRVRVLNAHQALIELQRINQLKRRGSVSDANFTATRDECRSLVKDDLVLSKDMASITIQLLANIGAAAGSKPAKLTRLSNQLQHSLALITPNYLHLVFENLEEAIRQNNLGNIDHLTSVLATELISRGWSQRTLYEAKGLFLSRKPFWNAWHEFREKALSHKKYFTCIAPFYTRDREVLMGVRGELSGLHVECLTGVELRRKLGDRVYDETIMSDQGLCMVIESNEHDPYSATATLTSRFDGVRETIHFFGINIEPHEYCLIEDHASNRFRKINLKRPWLPSTPSFRSNTFHTALDILTDDKREPETDLRLINALSSIAIADASHTSTSKFINLWIALESFCRYDGCEGIAENLVLVLPALLCRRYVYRICRNYIEDHNRALPSITEFAFGSSLRSRWSARIETLVKKTLSQDGKTELHNVAKGHTLLQYRTKQLISILSNSHTTANRIEAHSKRLAWHVRRMYRVRNSIVHSGTADPHIEPLVQHLRDYATLAITECIYMLAYNDLGNLGSVFERAIDENRCALDFLRSGGNISPELITKGILQSIQ